MSDALANLMLKNLSEVFGERDNKRRMVAIKHLYSEDAVFFEADQQFEGFQAISDAVAALQGFLSRRFRILSGGSPRPQPRRRPVVLATRSS